MARQNDLPGKPPGIFDNIELGTPDAKPLPPIFTGAPGTGDPGDAGGVPRSGLWSEEWELPRSGVLYASGTGSERAKVASVAEGNPPRARALPLEAASPGGVPVGVRRFRFGVPVPVVLSHGKSVRGVGQP
ncbi:MAG: hypothetical protein WBF16_04635 [Candidatus Deferrimicrobiaceae bacterium]